MPSTQAKQTNQTKSPGSANKSKTKKTNNKEDKKTNKTNNKEEKTNDAEEVKVNDNTQELQTLRERIRAMKRDAEEEARMLNQFQQEKEKINSFWQAEKQIIAQDEMLLQEKLRQKQELEDKQSYELKVYQQKVKHLLFEQQDAAADSKIDNQVNLSMAIDTQRDQEHEVNINIRQLSVQTKSLEVGYIDIVKNLKQEQEKKIMALREEFERKSHELLASARKKEKAVRREFQERRKMDVKRIEAKKDAHIRKLMAKHKQAFDDIKNYYRDITHNNLDLIKQLKDEVNTMRKADQQKEKEVNEISKVNEKISQPLQEHLTLVEKLKDDLKTYEREKVALQAAKHRLIVLEDQLKNLQWEHEILTQKHEQLVEERDEIKQTLEDTIYDAQQKTGFQKLLLEKKVTLLQEQLDKTDVTLAELLTRAHLAPDIVGDIKGSIRDVLTVKDKFIQELQNRVAYLKQEYYELIHVYETKLESLDISIDSIGFTPAPLD